MKKTLTEMSIEVAAVNYQKGWYDDERTFGELIALLHSEAGEALDAYRKYGFDDVTIPYPVAWTNPPKPEGVGVELADVFIRLLDMASRHKVDLDAEVAKYGGHFGINDSFGDQIAVLHLLISFVFMAWDESYKIFDSTPKAMAKVYIYLVQIAKFNGIDLEFEYERKLAYNKIRPYRHGGRKM